MWLLWLALTLVAMVTASCATDEADIEATAAAQVEAAVESRIRDSQAAPATVTPVRATFITRPPQATPTPVRATREYLLQLQSWQCHKETFGAAGGFAYVEGEVKNISGQRLENVEAVATWRTKAGAYITSDSSPIQFNPLLPGQTAPFKTISTLNPAMSGCGVRFKKLFGRYIPTTEK